MGKAKKGRKSVKDEDLDSDAEVEMTPTEAAPKPTKPKGKSKLKTDDSQKNPSDEDDNASDIKAAKKKKNIDDKKVTEVSKDVKKMNIGSKKSSKKKMASSDDDSNSESEAESVDIKPSKSKAKPEPKRGFALLQMDDSDDSPQSSDSDEDSESEEEKPKIVPQKKQPQKDLTKEQTTKKGKKGKKKKDDSDDDIDKVLAELEQEYSGKQASSSKKEKTQTEKSLNDETKEDVKSDITTQEPANNEKENVEDTTTAKSAAQKKKEKKLKQQAAKKLEMLNKESTPDPDPETVTVQSSTTVPNDVPIANEVETSKAEDQTEDSVESDKKKKKKKQEKPVEEKSKKGPAKKAIAAMQDALKKIKEEEERLQKEEEERIKLEEERENQRLELLRLEKEKKDRKKKKEKERKERLKAEGKFMTPKQKADKARALAMIESLKEQGAEISAEDQPRKPRLGTRIRPNKLKKQSSDEQQSSNKEESNKVDVEIVDSKTDGKEVIESKIPDIKDSWDAESASSDNDQDEDEEEKPVASETGKEASDSSDGDSESEGESESSDEDPEDNSSDTIAARQKTIIRMKKREEENEANKSAAVMRAAVVCVLGHVDTGKTKILDKLRRTNVQDGEAGGITQQIGATNVPIENIKEQTRHVKGVNQIEFKIPGLLIIDTPGHESFSNLRSRGSSLCDIAILVVDIMHGLEPQTIESINLLKARKTPFIVALNKIDRLYDWQSAQRKDVRDIIKSQHVNTQNEFETRTKETILQFAEQGLNAALYYENPDVRTYVSLVPTSAVTGEGMGNLLAIIIQACEGLLHKRLLFSQTLQATVLEVKAIPGLGMTIDTILINGTLKEGDTIVLAGTDGPIVTQIRSLLMPQPMKELRVKNAYIEYKEVVAAQGVKITGKDLEKAVAGLNLQVAHRLDEIDILKEEAARELKKALSGIKLSERGVYVQASTLGSLEALLQFLKSSKIPYSAIRIGPVVKRDVMKASAMLEHEPQYACILAFDVKIERDAQEMADTLGVTIFQADIIYHLFDKFMAHREQLKARKREEFKHIAVFPCKLKILPQFVFNSRDPIVIGVIVEAGIVKQGTPICVPSKEFVEIGIVTSIEMSHKQVETARKGMEVCIKIDPIPGESPKMFGRHFEETDFLVSKISRQSIDACKDYFRDDLIKADWQLMVELKNLFQIL